MIFPEVHICMSQRILNEYLYLSAKSKAVWYCICMYFNDFLDNCSDFKNISTD